MDTYQYVGEALKRVMGDESQGEALLPFVSNVVMQRVSEGSESGTEGVKSAVVAELKTYVKEGVEEFASDVVDYVSSQAGGGAGGASASASAPNPTASDPTTAMEGTTLLDTPVDAPFTPAGHQDEGAMEEDRPADGGGSSSVPEGTFSAPGVSGVGQGEVDMQPAMRVGRRSRFGGGDSDSEDNEQSGGVTAPQGGMEQPQHQQQQQQHHQQHHQQSRFGFDPLGGGGKKGRKGGFKGDRFGKGSRKGKGKGPPMFGGGGMPAFGFPPHGGKGMGPPGGMQDGLMGGGLGGGGSALSALASLGINLGNLAPPPQGNSPLGGLQSLLQGGGGGGGGGARLNPLGSLLGSTQAPPNTGNLDVSGVVNSLLGRQTQDTADSIHNVLNALQNAQRRQSGVFQGQQFHGGEMEGGGGGGGGKGRKGRYNDGWEKPKTREQQLLDQQLHYRLQCILVVCKVQPPLNNEATIRPFFEKFGRVTVVLCVQQKKNKAYVVFSKPSECTAAKDSPEAILGNRFISLYPCGQADLEDLVKIPLRPAQIPAHEGDALEEAQQRQAESLIRAELQAKQEQVDLCRQELATVREAGGNTSDVEGTLSLLEQEVARLQGTLQDMVEKHARSAAVRRDRDLALQQQQQQQQAQQQQQQQQQAQQQQQQQPGAPGQGQGQPNAAPWWASRSSASLDLRPKKLQISGFGVPPSESLRDSYLRFGEIKHFAVGPEENMLEVEYAQRWQAEKCQSHLNSAEPSLVVTFVK